MKARGYRNLLALAHETERQIAAANRPLPGREYTLSALTPSARAATKAARQVQKAERLLARAQDLAHQSARIAYASADAVAAGWIAASEPVPPPRSAPRLGGTVPFDTAAFRVALERIPAARADSEHTEETTC